MLYYLDHRWQKIMSHARQLAITVLITSNPTTKQFHLRNIWLSAFDSSTPRFNRLSDSPTKQILTPLLSTTTNQIISDSKPTTEIKSYCVGEFSTLDIFYAWWIFRQNLLSLHHLYTFLEKSENKRTPAFLDSVPYYCILVLSSWQSFSAEFYRLRLQMIVCLEKVSTPAVVCLTVILR